MKNKNLLLFIVLSMGLLGVYYALTSRYYPPPAAPPQAQVQVLPQAQAAPKTAVSTTSTTPELPVALPGVDPGGLFVLSLIHI